MSLTTPRAWLQVLALWGTFALALAGITAVSHPSGNPPPLIREIQYYTSGQHGTPPCFTVLVQSLRTEHAGGVWECFSPRLKQAFFVGDGWQGNADFQRKYLDRFASIGVQLEVRTYSGNPVCTTSLNGQQTCNQWLMYVTPILSDGTRAEGNAFSLTATINASGEIDALA